MDREILFCSGPAEIAEKAAEDLTALIHKKRGGGKPFTLALAGGSTPKTLYRLLAGGKYLQPMDWKSVHLFWGDERSVPPDNDESNFKMVKESLLEKISIPEENIHPFRGEEADGAERYELSLKKVFSRENTPPRFDCILLGMGDDGHTASLFPDCPAIREKRRWVARDFVEKLNTHRLTLTPPVIKEAENLFFLVSGEGKAPALKEVLEGKFQPEKFPAQIEREASGRRRWFVDTQAARHLTGTFAK